MLIAVALTTFCWAADLGSERTCVYSAESCREIMTLRGGICAPSSDTRLEKSSVVEPHLCDGPCGRAGRNFARQSRPRSTWQERFRNDFGRDPFPVEPNNSKFLEPVSAHER